MFPPNTFINDLPRIGSDANYIYNIIKKGIIFATYLETAAKKDTPV